MRAPGALLVSRPPCGPIKKPVISNRTQLTSAKSFQKRPDGSEVVRGCQWPIICNTLAQCCRLGLVFHYGHDCIEPRYVVQRVEVNRYPGLCTVAGGPDTT